ncbi:MAG: hypothetical protein L0922_05020, partial [Candidatus Mariimomonas ferrooxydans]
MEAFHHFQGQQQYALCVILQSYKNLLHTTSTITHTRVSTLPQPSLTPGDSTLPQPSLTPGTPHYLNHHS